MKKYAGILSLLSFLFVACNRDEAAVPAYITVDRMDVSTTFTSQGSNSSDISTIWVEVDGVLIGTYQLPATFPVIVDQGKHDVVIYPGIRMNGISNTRSIYEFYKKYEENIQLTPGVVHYLDAANDSVPTVTYADNIDIDDVESFEGTGLRMEKSSRSDTNIFRTTDAGLIYEPYGSETNNASGIAYMGPNSSIFEMVTIDKYILPAANANVYLEFDYRIDVPLTVGVYAETSSQIIQQQTVQLNPTKNWKKVYVNLVTETSGITGAKNFKIFLGAVKTANNQTDTLMFDNLKLVY